MFRKIVCIVFIGIFVISIKAQTTEFTYQGSLKDGTSAANGSYDFEFVLYDAVSGGAQIGSTLTRSTVAVANGDFSVKLDFGSQFPGANRFLEIRVRQSGGGAFTPLAPRQQVNSAPYSVKAVNAENAVNATTAANATNAATATNATQLGGVAANQYVTTTSGNSSYIQNTTAPQASSNFNISGTGTANIFNTATQYNIGGSRVLSVPGFNNTFAGVNAGTANVYGYENSFFGRSAGSSNTDGNQNSFFGRDAGVSNTTASYNSFFGRSAGSANTVGYYNSFFGSNAGYNTSGGSNSFFGYSAGYSNNAGRNNTIIGDRADVGAGDLINAIAIGNRAFVTQSNSLVLGSINGVNSATASTNVGIGITAPTERLHVVGNGLFTGNLTVSGTLNATLPSGSANYIQNQNAAPQASSNFNISGNGTANIFNATTQFNIGGNRVLSVAGYLNTFAGIDSGSAITEGHRNSFFGRDAGRVNTDGYANSFFGYQSGFTNTTGYSNSFFGVQAGFINTTGNSNLFFGGSAGNSNTTGSSNTIIGGAADVGAGDLTNAIAIGYRAFVTQSNSLVLGSINGANNATADTKVGIGTTAPTERLHVVGNGLFAGNLTVSSSAQTPFSATGSNTGGTWSNLGNTSTDGRTWNFIAAGSGNAEGAGKLLFRDNNANAVRMTLDTSGNVGIGTTSPAQKLDVQGNIRVATGTTGCVEDRDGTVIAGACSSDLRFKREITPFGSTLNGFSKLRPVNFYWRKDEFAGKNFGAKQSFGLIAQEVEAVFPDLVSTDEQGYKVVNYSKLPLLTIQAVKEQQAQIEAQQKQIEQQRKQIESLTKVVCAINSNADICR